MKKHFPIGSLDKHGKHVKTENGWVKLKGNEHLVNQALVTERFLQAVEANEKVATTSKILPKFIHNHKYDSIQAIQEALCKKEITHFEYWELQQALLTNRLRSLKFNPENETTS